MSTFVNSSLSVYESDKKVKSQEKTKFNSLFKQLTVNL